MSNHSQHMSHVFGYRRMVQIHVVWYPYQCVPSDVPFIYHFILKKRKNIWSPPNMIHTSRVPVKKKKRPHFWNHKLAIPPHFFHFISKWQECRQNSHLVRIFESQSQSLEMGILSQQGNMTMPLPNLLAVEVLAIPNPRLRVVHCCSLLPIDPCLHLPKSMTQWSK